MEDGGEIRLVWSQVAPPWLDPYGLPRKEDYFRAPFPRFDLNCSFEKSGKIKRAQGVRFLFWLKEQICSVVSLEKCRDVLPFGGDKHFHHRRNLP